jgi:hypothetical protein
LSCRLVVAVDAASPPQPNPAAINGSTDMNASATPAMMALPANSTPLSGDASSSRKWYTLSASLREIYDDNVNTSNTNPQASFETELAPSILVDFPSADSDFSARYTFDVTYYSNAAAVNNSTGTIGSNNGTIEYTQEFIAQYAHAFSDRFNLSLADDLRYFTEPSILESTGTNYNNGAYVSNSFNGTMSAQWTPLFGTTSTFSNAVIKYDNSTVAFYQNSIENTGTQILSFAILPKISVNLGGIVDDISYEDVARGYTTYTGFIGAGWQTLPSLSVSGQAGGSYVVPDLGQDYVSPYAALTINWTLGKRSALVFNYAHEVTPSDQVDANGQISDRFSSSFRYDITPSLSAHLQGIFTYADVSQQLLISNTGTGYTESIYELDTGLTYHYNSYLDFDSGITLSGVSGVSSDISSTNDYSRNQVYVGVRGTY